MSADLNDPGTWGLRALLAIRLAGTPQALLGLLDGEEVPDLDLDPFWLEFYEEVGLWDMTTPGATEEER